MADVNSDATAVSYLSSFDVPLNVTIMSTASQWSLQQQMTYNAILPYLARDFHGLQDFYDQLNLYSSSNIILRSAWALIQGIALLNLNVQKEMYIDPDLGKIGNLFALLPGFGKVFSVSSTDDISSDTSGS